MKGIAAIFFLLACLAHSPAGEHVTLYAKLLAPLQVELSDSAVWEMEKGDCFPVVAYKESHTKLILRLGGAQFVVAGNDAAIVNDNETPAAIERYRVTLQNYMNGFAARWKANAEAAAKK